MLSLDADMRVSISCPSPGMNSWELREVNMLEHAEDRQQSLKEGLIELEDGLNI